MIQHLTMRQLFKEYCNEIVVPYWADVKECISELVNYFKS